MWGASLDNRYGLYDFFTSPSRTSNTLISLKDKQIVPLKNGRNVFATGAYKLIVKKKGFIDFETNFFLTTKGMSHHITLTEKPFTLIVSTGKVPVDVYLDSRLISTNYSYPRITISNLPPKRYSLALFHSHHSFFYKSFHPKYKSEVFLEAKPFYHYQNTLIATSLLGLLPGLNYFIHFPRSTVGLVIPNLVIYYFFVIGYVIESSGIDFVDENNLSSSSQTIKNSLLGGAIIASVFHAFFSFLGTKKDLDDIRERHQNKLTWRVKMDLRESFYAMSLSYRIKGKP